MKLLLACMISIFSLSALARTSLTVSIRYNDRTHHNIKSMVLKGCNTTVVLSTKKPVHQYNDISACTTIALFYISESRSYTGVGSINFLPSSHAIDIMPDGALILYETSSKMPIFFKTNKIVSFNTEKQLYVHISE